MDSDITQPALSDRLWVWSESHKKQLLIGLIAVLVVGLGIGFWFSHLSQAQADANNALSKLASRTMMPSAAPPPNADAFLKVASEFSGTDAAQRATLLAGTDLFVNGNYDQARAQFQRLLQEYSDSPFSGQAAMGVAATLEAQGKTNDAIDAYRNVTEHYIQNWNVGPQAKLALARLLVAQGKLEDARGELIDVVRNFPGEVGAEANEQLRELFTAHPELIPANPAPRSSALERPRVAPSAPVISTNRSTATPPLMISTNRSAGPPPLIIPAPTNNP